MQIFVDADACLVVGIVLFHRIIVLRQWHWEKMRMQYLHFPAATALKRQGKHFNQQLTFQKISPKFGDGVYEKIQHIVQEISILRVIPVFMNIPPFY